MALSWTNLQLASAFGAIVLPAVLLTQSALAQAGRFTVDDRLSTRLVYTDNRRLDSTQESDFVLDVRPGVAVQRSGARARLDLEYDLGISQSLSGDQDIRLSNFLDAAFSSELYEDTWFLDARAGADLVGTSGLATLESDGIYDDDNSTQAYSFSVSPYSRHHFGKYVDLLTRTTFDFVGAQEGSISESGGFDFSASLQSGRHFARVPWALTFRHNVIDREDRSDERSSLTGQVTYVYDRHWSIFSSLGIESNDVSTIRSDTDGMTWSIGGTWIPTPRTSVAASYGERYFGTNWDVNLTHRSRRTRLTAGLTRSVSNARNIVQEALVGTLLVDGQPLIDSVTGEPVELEVLVPRLIDEDFVQDQFRLGATVTGKRSSISLQSSWSNRSYEVSGSEEDAYNITASFSRRLTPRSDGSVRASWQQVDPNDSDSRSTYLVGLNFSHRLGRYSSVSVDISHRHQDEANGNSFDENRLSAGLATQIW